MIEGILGNYWRKRRLAFKSAMKESYMYGVDTSFFGFLCLASFTVGGV
jgi:hypothetical protein